MRKKAKVSKFYDGRRLVIGVWGTDDLERAKIIANEIFKVRKDELDASYAIVRGNALYYDGGYTKEKAHVVAVYRKEFDL